MTYLIIGLFLILIAFVASGIITGSNEIDKNDDATFI